MIPRFLLHQRNLRNLRNIARMKISYLAMGCNFNAHHIAWGSTNCNDRQEALVEFLNSSNGRFLIRAMSPPFAVLKGKR
jgi:hypothetical protein